MVEMNCHYSCQILINLLLNTIINKNVLQLYKTKGRLQMGKERIFRSYVSPIPVNRSSTMLGELRENSRRPHHPFNPKQDYLGHD